LFTAQHVSGVNKHQEKLSHQVGDLFELNVKLQCQKVKLITLNIKAMP
jgi:hypothetical protein